MISMCTLMPQHTWSLPAHACLHSCSFPAHHILILAHTPMHASHPTAPPLDKLTPMIAHFHAFLPHASSRQYDQRNSILSSIRQGKHIRLVLYLQLQLRTIQGLDCSSVVERLLRVHDTTGHFCLLPPQTYSPQNR